MKNVVSFEGTGQDTPEPSKWDDESSDEIIKECNGTNWGYDLPPMNDNDGNMDETTKLEEDVVDDDELEVEVEIEMDDQWQDY